MSLVAEEYTKKKAENLIGIISTLSEGKHEFTSYPFNVC